MYKIIKNGEVIELQDDLTWVCDQKNGVIITCEKEGQGILCGSYGTDKEGNIVFQQNAVIYSVVGKPQLRDFEFVEIKEVKWYPIVEQHRADIDYLAIMTEVEL